ncbi:GerAB/ArcD/ProY family transporter [Paenibacillus psychroresistens]|uniref:GerAB/ArcD/ProY family transporter n=1 Tax=Paenibacillus psychroresistens TaxID=1778678 RepID=UPI0013909710|nr:endospore germination permease [Paenibacillus psychroresistens]
MQPTEKITGTQLGLLLFTFIVSTVIITIPSMTVMFAKQDAWISVFPAALSGLLSIWVMTALGNRYPGLTIIQYSPKIIGKWLGGLLGIYYIYYWFVFIMTTTMLHANFINALLLPKSPSIVANLTLFIICSLAVFTGIEVIARCNEFITLLILFFIIPLLILITKEGDINQLKPILGGGILPVLQGAIGPAGGFMNQLFILGWLLPYLNKPKKARTVSLIALFGISILIFFIVLLTIMILGPLAGNLTYPFLSVIQYVGIEGSFERLEAIAVSMWVTGIFVKISVTLFILCISISQLMGIRNYRDFIPPIALLSIIGSVFIHKNEMELHNFIVFTFPILAFLNQNLIPMLLLLIDTIKRRF